MRAAHFEAFAPRCPACRVARGADAPLEVAFVDRGDAADDILEGALRCTSAQCQAEYPILDGIPILMPDPSAYLAESIGDVTARDDLGGRVADMLGEACGPGSAYDLKRTHLSSYGEDHWSDQAPGAETESSVVDLLDRAVQLARIHSMTLVPEAASRLVELGCGPGRPTFELARRAPTALALGVDKHFPMLRLAARAARAGVVRYPRRNIGLLYDTVDFALGPDWTEARARVDFWVADAAALPLPNRSADAVLGFGLLDAAASPLDVLRETARVLQSDRLAAFAAPWDWSAAVTTPAAWIGGHSPRGFEDGDPAAVLRALLTPGAHPASVAGLRLAAEDPNVPWRVRVHARSVVHYSAQLVVLQSESAASE